MVQRGVTDVEEGILKHALKAAIEVEVGASEVYPHRFGHLLQRFEALWEQHHIGRIDGCHRDRRYDIAMVVCDGDDVLPLLVLVARVPNSIAPFFATVLVPSPCRI
jgi:hypothetical protein